VDAGRLTMASARILQRSRWVALVVVSLGQLMSVVDETIVNVALAPIQRGLHFALPDLTWILNAYLISFGGFLLVAGRLGDLVGRRRVFLIGVMVFTASSAVCGAADSKTVLIAARFVQGLGAAAASSTIIAIVATDFGDATDRARAMGIYSFIASGGASLGLLAGGFITHALGWHWIFLINVPIGVITLVLGRLSIRENTAPGIDRGSDILAALLVTAALMVLVYAIVTSSSAGWLSAHTLSACAIAGVLMLSFVAAQARTANPMMPLRVFRTPGLGAACIVRGLLMVGFFATLFIGVLYLETAHRYGPLQTGLSFVSQTVVYSSISLGPAAILVQRFGPRLPLLVGFPPMIAGLLLFAHAGAHTAYFFTLCAAFAATGIGGGLMFMPLLIVAMAEIGPSDAGLASGIINASTQMSAALGVAVLGTIAADRTRNLLLHGAHRPFALLDGYHLAFAVGTGAVVAAAMLTVLLIRGRR